MKKMILLLLLCALGLPALSQSVGGVYQHDRTGDRSNPMTVNPVWAPFYHGVASGDPLSDRVVIWTRVTPDEMNSIPVEVDWRIATDPDLENTVQTGSFATGPERDYTVKVDVTGLEAGTTYYYGFTAQGQHSLTGRTKTTPADDQAGHLKFGVVSCSNFQHGYFNAYRRLADRNDLDAVIHLGDYIYEYGNGGYGDSTLLANRPLEPETEIVSLEDYRARYSTYRLDTALARIHQQHPFITVWDDHESANDAYATGAQNHDPATEGEWETRKAVAKQVYFEWMPIRDTEDQQVYRTIRYGNLLDLIMLDTRLEGREQQVQSVEDSTLYAADRTLLGAEQKAWLLDQLSNSTARWKALGQQVLFSEFTVGWAALQDTSATYNSVESIFLDIWDGYPAERSELISFVADNGIDNVVILTGDFHSSFAFDVIDLPVTVSFLPVPNVGEVPMYATNPDYDEATGAGARMVEFATPSVTSANFDENTSLPVAQIFQYQVNHDLQANGFNLGNPNPHLRYTDLIRHGYFILDVKADSVQADFYYTPIDVITEEQVFGQGWYTKDGENHLNQAAAASAPKATLDPPAPNDPPLTNQVRDARAEQKFAILGVYPNPFREINTLHYALTEPLPVRIDLYDAKGDLVRNLADGKMLPGIFSLELPAGNLAKGVYFYRIRAGEQQLTARVVLAR